VPGAGARAGASLGPGGAWAGSRRLPGRGPSPDRAGGASRKEALLAWCALEPAPAPTLVAGSPACQTPSPPPTPSGAAPQVALRVHDACFTSEVLGSLKCDCAEQLQLAMEYIHANAPGIVIYLWQEGRGIGLANKIAAYKLQEQGLDTVDANRALGLPDDSREYTSVRNILKELGVKSVRLMTNNPRKISELSDLGVKVNGRMPCQVQAGTHNKVRRRAARAGARRRGGAALRGRGESVAAGGATGARPLMGPLPAHPPGQRPAPPARPWR
jgi:GTP cyclohydrolase II